MIIIGIKIRYVNYKMLVSNNMLLTKDINQHIIAVYQQNGGDNMDRKNLTESEHKLLESFATLIPKLSEQDRSLTLAFAMGLVAKEPSTIPPLA